MMFPHFFLWCGSCLINCIKILLSSVNRESGVFASSIICYFGIHNFRNGHVDRVNYLRRCKASSQLCSLLCRSGTSNLVQMGYACFRSTSLGYGYSIHWRLLWIWAIPHQSFVRGAHSRERGKDSWWLWETWHVGSRIKNAHQAMGQSQVNIRMWSNISGATSGIQTCLRLNWVFKKPCEFK